ncbi:MAG: hypothetical protein NZ529_06065 [Cytophagaceae bacterium]|nr:hypothetical protein [Cytophagaceae bacterium]MDW8456344.1 glycoside hydrolase family 2 protein [Cytophagaceae bacterium]
MLSLFSCSEKKNPKIRIELHQNWKFRKNGDAVWLPATVPGTVHTDLMQNNKIPDPFYRTNEKDLQWIEKEDWEYITFIQVDNKLAERENIDLVFEGLDTYADVFVNDSLVLQANNMFRQWRCNVKPYLKEGNNKLRIYFTSPIKKVMPIYESLSFQYPANNDQAQKKVSMFTRKAPYHYGWDWGPRFVTSGIWKPVYLEAWDCAKIQNVQFVQKELNEKAASVLLNVEIFSSTDKEATIEAYLDKVKVATLEVKLTKGLNKIECPFRIDNPKLWWPNGVGSPNLYEIVTKLNLANSTIDSDSMKIGLRTIEVVHEKDENGKSFYFKVNGVPVFMKGANYIPSDNFLNRVDEKKYKMLIQSALDANMNMLRVWGGGIYENDIFYNLCDENGILIWQDFMFSCSMYPGDSGFVNNVKAEITENIRRLRNHPCIALWSGNNEMEVGWAEFGWQKQHKYTPEHEKIIWGDYVKMFHEIIPSIVKKEDPGRFYTRSSPSANDDSLPANKLNLGDMHYWGVWHFEEPYEKYRDNTSRFMSEYGFQSFPEFSTVKKYTVKEDWNIESPVMLAHQRHPRGNQLIKKYMERDYKTPKNFEAFLYVSQVLQAEIIKFAAESHRQKMPHCMGSLYWQLNDCWPVASWSGMDYYGNYKALHYYAKNFFSPILVSPALENDSVRVYVISDKLNDMPGKLTVRLIDFEGKEYFTEKLNVNVKSNSSAVYISYPIKKFTDLVSPNRSCLVVDLVSDENEIISTNILFFKKTKECVLPKSNPSIKIVKREKNTITLEIESKTLIKNLYLTTDYDAKFSENYFNVLPGRKVTVILNLPENADLAKTDDINIQSVDMSNVF